MSFYPNGQPNPGRFPVQNHSSGGQSGDYTSRPPPVITRPAHPVGNQPIRAPIRPPHQAGTMNPMMKMMMSMMKSNPNVDSDWIEFCLPRMMEQMQQMSEEFKRKKMVDMISNDDYDRISQALAGMGQIKHPGQTNEQNATNFRRMVGALAMKGKTATPTVPPMAPPVDVQIDPKIQKNRLIIQMRNNLRLKYQILYYAKECKEMLLKIEREIQSTDTIFEREEKENLSRLLEILKIPLDQNNQKEFKANFGRVKEICERSLGRMRSNLASARTEIDSGSKKLSDFRNLLNYSFMMKQASNICVLVLNCELAVVRINNLPDIHCVDSWGKMWCQLWKLNVVRNPSASAFTGPDGDLLKEMFSLFKSDYAILVEKLTPLGQVSETGVRVEEEHLKPDAELLKQALIPKDPKKTSQLNELLYQQLQKQLNEAEDEAESNSDAHNDELEMHAKLLKESKNSRDALKRLKNWLGENFNKPLIRKSLVSRLESIQSSIGNLSEDHKTLLEAIFTHLEEKRGWLADRFDALDEDRLIECSVQLAVVILTAKSDCVINLLGGITSKVGAALTAIKKHKTPILLNDQLVSDIIALIKSDEDIKNEDEIDLNDISDEDDEPDKPALNLKEHLKGLINKVDGLNGDADGGDEPKFEAISSDEDDDDQPAHFGGISLAPPPPPSTLPREDISDSDDDISNPNGFRIQAIDNTSVQDYSNIMFEFGHSRQFGFFAGSNTETHPNGSFYEKVATRKKSNLVDDFEKEFYSKTTSNKNNLTLILTQGDSTPTYDEPSSSADESKGKRGKHGDDSAEEGECNDDGVELKPSLRIRNLPSPEREQDDANVASKSSVLLRRIPEDSPETTGKKTRKVTLYKKKQKEVSLEDIQMEQISSDEDEKEENVEKSQTEELKVAPEVVEKVPEMGSIPENTKIPEDSEAEKKNLDDSIKSENSTKEDATKKDETKIEKEERKRKKSERKEAKRAKKEAKKAKKEKKRADRERKKSERDEKSIDKIEDDEEDITDTEETDYTNIEVTKLDIIDGLNSSQAKPANLNEDPVLKREAEKKKEKEAEKKLRTSIHDIPPPPPPGKPPKKSANQAAPPPPPPPKHEKRSHKPSSLGMNII